MAKIKMKSSVLILGSSISLMVFGFAIAQPNQAQVSEQEVFKSFEDCATLKTDSFRLSCFDLILAGETYSQQKMAEEKVEAFGKDMNKDATTDLIVEVIKISRGSAGTMMITLKNGQVWKQTGDRKLLSRTVPYKAEIKKRTFGGYQFSPVGTKRTIKVKRFK